MTNAGAGAKNGRKCSNFPTLQIVPQSPNRLVSWADLLFYFLASSYILESEYVGPRLYEFIIDKQPIGKALFKQFCSSNLKFNALVEFMEDLERYEISVEDQRLNIACEIMLKYFTEEVTLFILVARFTHFFFSAGAASYVGRA